jgi:hypothetical protein
MDQQVIRLLNISPYGMVLQDQGTLAKSNLRLTAAKITLGPRSSMTLVYLSAAGAWIQSGPVTKAL